jgi:hypothetical protein
MFVARRTGRKGGVKEMSEKGALLMGTQWTKTPKHLSER